MGFKPNLDTTLFFISYIWLDNSDFANNLDCLRSEKSSEGIEKKMKDITLSLIEIFISLIVETVILGGLFAWISNKASQTMQQKLQDEMNNIEAQNKFIFQQIKEEMRMSRKDIISQIKETGGN